MGIDSTFLFASVKFAIETAVLNALAASKKQPLSKFLSSPSAVIPVGFVPIAGLIDNTGSKAIDVVVSEAKV